MRLFRRLEWWFRQRSHQADLTDELAMHREMVEDDLRRRGLPPAIARSQARRRMGNETYMREEARGIWIRPVIDDLWRDTAIIARSLARRPRFTAGMVLTLALGVGVNGAAFSILRTGLLARLPYRDPSRLVVLSPTTAGELATAQPRSAALTAPMVLRFRAERAADVGEVAAVRTEGIQGLTPLAHRVNDAQLDLVLQDRTIRLNGAHVTPNFFTLLGVRAARGRVFAPDDARRAEDMVVLSDATWRRAFAGDPSIVGRVVSLGGGTGGERSTSNYLVAGVLPASFHFTYPGEVEAWVLVRWRDVERYDPHVIAFTAVARLQPGLSLPAARVRAAALALANDGTGPDRTVIALTPMRDWVVGNTRPSLQLLGAVAAMLLLVSCFTVANGQLARLSERRQEFAVRSALGAGRGRLVRQLFTEGAMLSAAGAVSGMLLAGALHPFLRELVPASIPRIDEMSVDAGFLAFGFALAAATTIIATLTPAWGASRGAETAGLALQTSRASASRSTVLWRQGFVALQAAATSSLMVAASLLLVSFWRLGRVPLGFDGERVVSMELQLLDAKYAMSRAGMRLFQDDLLSRVGAIPGVAEAALASAVPFRKAGGPILAARPGTTTTELILERLVDPGFFRVLRIGAIRGRVVNESDRDGAPLVTVISASYARSIFGDQDPIGRMIGTVPALEVVGVVPDVRYMGKERDLRPAIYVPMAQGPTPLFSLLARADGSVPAASVTAAITSAIRELDPRLPPIRIATLDELADSSAANRRFYTVSTVTFAALALLLTLGGLSVVVAQGVAERSRELAIRSALGASGVRLLRLVSRDVSRAVVLGLVVGLAVAYAGAGLLRRVLVQVAPHAPATYLAVAIVIMVVATLGAWEPVRRFHRAPLVSMLKAE